MKLTQDFVICSSLMNHGLQFNLLTWLLASFGSVPGTGGRMSPTV